jgi:GAF domain-containing protein
MIGIGMPQNHQKLRNLIEVIYELNVFDKPELLLEKILEGARLLVNADAGTIYIKHGEQLIFSHVQNETLQRRLSPGEALIYLISPPLPLTNESIAGYVANTGKMVNVHDIYQLRRSQVPYVFNRSYDDKAQYRTRSMLTLPLMSRKDRVFGVLQLINARNSQRKIVPFFGTDLPFIHIFARKAVAVIRRSKRRLSKNRLSERNSERSIV